MVYVSDREALLLHGGRRNNSPLAPSSETWELSLIAASQPGDLNCDCRVNALDIEPFILALFDPEGYGTAYPDCDRLLGDLNADGVVNALDIEPFVEVLFP